MWQVLAEHLSARTPWHTSAERQVQICAEDSGYAGDWRTVGDGIMHRSDLTSLGISINSNQKWLKTRKEGFMEDIKEHLGENQDETPFEKEEKKRQAIINMSKDEYDDMMCKRFPDIFVDRHKSMRETCMCWGFDIGNGWFPLLLELCCKIDFICRTAGVKVVADQVKEKLATLRFYFHVVGNGTTSKEDINIIDSIVQDCVCAADRESSHVCEKCGQSGRIYTIGGWLMAFCSQHAKQHAESKGFKWNDGTPDEVETDKDFGDI